jgi:hypothetical protein
MNNKKIITSLLGQTQPPPPSMRSLETLSI